MTKLDYVTLDSESRFLNITKNTPSAEPFNIFEESLVDILFDKHLEKNENDSINNKNDLTKLAIALLSYSLPQ